MTLSSDIRCPAGEWKPKQIDNPNYKGPWIHPEIDNPEYIPDDKLYKYDEVCAVGFDLWQVKAGTIFDNVLITDDEKEADAIQNEILERVKAEKKMKEQLDEEERKAATPDKTVEETNDLDDDEKDEADADKTEDPEEEGETHDEL